MLKHCMIVLGLVSLFAFGCKSEQPESSSETSSLQMDAPGMGGVRRIPNPEAQKLWTTVDPNKEYCGGKAQSPDMICVCSGWEWRKRPDVKP